ncbi:MAG: hypothetical protein ACRDS0_27100 [Pseudonocardiaceae bacterium]
MPGGVGRVAPRVARLLSACVVMIGLFAMHGLPASADGCHAGLAMTPPTGGDTAMASPMTSAVGHSVAAADVVAGATAHPVPPSNGAGAGARPSGDGLGELCVSLAPRQDATGGPGWIAALAMLLATIMYLTSPVSVTRLRGSPRRGSPLAGSVLLTRVGVSLT